MHEMGVVFHVMDMVEDVAEENELSKVTSVTLQLGEVSGVIFSSQSEKSGPWIGFFVQPLTAGLQIWLICGTGMMHAIEWLFLPGRWIL